MGVTISSTIGIERQNTIRALNRTREIAGEMRKQAQALYPAMAFEIRRPSIYELLIDIGKCETLGFRFAPYASYARKPGEWGGNFRQEALQSYFSVKLLEKSPENYEHLKRWPGQEILWSQSFCKTQFANDLVEHRYVAELIRSLAQVADYAHVHDEGDYYHTLEINDAAKAIQSNGAMINSLAQTFTGLGFEGKKGGETVIKPHRKNI